jgi:threonylcarbamoyladenosine tRNA methylthiotransferase MtaB
MCAITTDIMTGFPQETDEEFSETLSFAEKIGFAKIHVFRYSVRPGTKAAEMSGQVPENKKTDRADKLQRLSESMQLRHNKSLENRVIPVLFEREKGDGYHAGHAPDGTVIKIPEKNIKKSLRKSIFYVRIEESDAACCYGVIDGGSSANPL